MTTTTATTTVTTTTATTTVTTQQQRNSQDNSNDNSDNEKMGTISTKPPATNPTEWHIVWVGLPPYSGKTLNADAPAVTLCFTSSITAPDDVQVVPAAFVEACAGGHHVIGLYEGRMMSAAGSNHKMFYVSQVLAKWPGASHYSRN